MKTTFEIASVCLTALPGVNIVQLVNAVQSTLNSAKGKLDKEAQRSDVKHTSKGVEFAFNETGERIKYIGNANMVSRFVAEHDSLKSHYKRHGAPSKPLSADVWTAETRTWLDDTFTGKASAGNGHKKEQSANIGKRRNLVKA